jgi:hypothetical protein
MNSDSNSQPALVALQRLPALPPARAPVWRGESLRELCLRALLHARDSLGHVGDVPAELLIPIAERMSADALRAFEAHNPALRPALTQVWQAHCRSTSESGDWRAAYEIERAVERSRLRLAGGRLTQRAAAADDGRSRLRMIDPAEVPAASTARASGQRQLPPPPPTALQKLRLQLASRAKGGRGRGTAAPAVGRPTAAARGGGAAAGGAAIRAAPHSQAGGGAPAVRPPRPLPPRAAAASPAGAPPAAAAGKKRALEWTLGARPAVLGGRALPRPPPPPPEPVRMFKRPRDGADGGRPPARLGGGRGGGGGVVSCRGNDGGRLAGSSSGAGAMPAAALPSTDSGSAALQRLREVDIV